MSEQYLWWGYLHVNGAVQVKRFDENSGRYDIDDAEASDFVVRVCDPFEASGREDALNKAAKLLNA